MKRVHESDTASEEEFQDENGDGSGVLDEHKSRILNETKNVSSFVVIGQTLHKLYYEDRLMKTQKEFLEWTKANLGFSKSTTYEYIISYRIYSEIANKISKEYRPPMYQSHCQLLSKVPQKKLVETWMDVCRQAPNGVITTAFLETYVDRHNLRAKSGRVAIQAPDTYGSAASAADHAAVRAITDGNVGGEDELPIEEEALIGGTGADEGADGRVTDSMMGASTSTLAKTDSNASMNSNGLMAAAAGTTMNGGAEGGNMNGVNGNVIESDSKVGAVPQPSALRSPLPINEPLIFELSKNVVLNNEFDMVLQTVDDFRAAEPRPWFGRLWANLTGVRPLTTATMYTAPPSNPLVPMFEGGLEHLLRIIFTKFAGKEFSEGLFLLRAEFGADWFTPILQHPYCVLRHTNPPLPIQVPYAARPSSLNPAKKPRRIGNVGMMQTSVQPPFESYVMFYLGPNIKDFCHVFRSIGLVPGINSWSAVMSVNNIVPNLSLLNVGVLPTHSAPGAEPVDGANANGALSAPPPAQGSMTDAASKQTGRKAKQPKPSNDNADSETQKPNRRQTRGTPSKKNEAVEQEDREVDNVNDDVPVEPEFDEKTADDERKATPNGKRKRDGDEDEDEQEGDAAVETGMGDDAMDNDEGGDGDPVEEESEEVPNAGSSGSNGGVDKMKERMKKLAQLKAMRNLSKTDNRKDVYAEHQRLKSNPKAETRTDWKRKEAEELQAKLAAEEEGVDYERVRAMNYSVEDVERYEKKQKKKEKNMDHGFTDFAQISAKKYKKQVREIKPNFGHYQEQKREAQLVGNTVSGDVNDDGFYRDANNLAYAAIGNKPSEESVDKLVKEVLKQEEMRKNFSRRRAFNEDEDVTYINERNMRFNKKISRAYDKYTADIKASFERGTAL
ncbi:hypothetical protein HDU76_013379 [Blyttiomyces sp. JEL0837]|nr:hypothetical protein HDU76_013379 [Blyttiomyces sp. JEL0837]